MKKTKKRVQTMSNFEVKRINQRLAELEKQGKLVTYMKIALFEINDHLIEIKQRLNDLEKKLWLLRVLAQKNGFLFRI